VSDLTGKVFINATFNGIVPVASLPAGIYIAEIKAGDHIVSRKFLKD
jgi:hypothetical protein